MRVWFRLCVVFGALWCALLTFVSDGGKNLIPNGAWLGPPIGLYLVGALLIWAVDRRLGPPIGLCLLGALLIWAGIGFGY